MKLSVIVPAFNEERELPGSLRSIRAATDAWTRRGWETELIVCDNNSTDRTAGIAGEAGAIVVFEPVNQIGRARNAGATRATGDWLVFVDADSHPNPELFEDVARAIESGRFIAVGAIVVFDEADTAVRFAGSMWNAWSRASRWMAGSFIACEAAAFRQVGGFDLELYAAEEINLSRKLKRLAGARGKRVGILTQHPLVTSGRKGRLYTPGEMWGFMLRTVLRGGRTLRNAEDCIPWYDGRR